MASRGSRSGSPPKISNDYKIDGYLSLINKYVLHADLIKIITGKSADANLFNSKLAVQKENTELEKAKHAADEKKIEAAEGALKTAQITLVADEAALKTAQITLVADEAALKFANATAKLEKATHAADESREALNTASREKEKAPSRKRGGFSFGANGEGRMARGGVTNEEWRRGATFLSPF
jgi:hypothetical protein